MNKNFKVSFEGRFPDWLEEEFKSRLSSMAYGYAPWIKKIVITDEESNDYVIEPED